MKRRFFVCSFEGTWKARRCENRIRNEKTVSEMVLFFYDIAVLENHGVVVGSDSLFHAFKAFENLDFCAKLRIIASIIGQPKYLKEENIQLKYTENHINMDEFVHKMVTSREKAMRRDMCNIIHRAYDQGLVNSTQGSFSVRLDEESFLISPNNVDRKYVD